MEPCPQCHIRFTRCLLDAYAALNRVRFQTTKGRTSIDWQHGVGRVDMMDETVLMTLIPIEDGKFVLDGNVLQGQERISEIRRATGLNV